MGPQILRGVSWEAGPCEALQPSIYSRSAYRKINAVRSSVL